ncbi:unnamed protein product, partial [marine sediment metagenome]
MPVKTDFQLIETCVGYISKPDKTNAPIRALVNPSQNCLINDEEMVESRPGYSRLGAANVTLYPIESSYDWDTSSNARLTLRGYDDELEVYVGTVNSVVFNSWERVLDGWDAVDFDFAAWWDTDENIDLLLIVNGEDK